MLKRDTYFSLTYLRMNLFALVLLKKVNFALSVFKSVLEKKLKNVSVVDESRPCVMRHRLRRSSVPSAGWGKNLVGANLLSQHGTPLEALHKNILHHPGNTIQQLSLIRHFKIVEISRGDICQNKLLVVIFEKHFHCLLRVGNDQEVEFHEVEITITIG